MMKRRRTVYPCPLCDDDMVMDTNHDEDVAWLCSGCWARLSVKRGV